MNFVDVDVHTSLSGEFIGRNLLDSAVTLFGEIFSVAIFEG
jgi:hypothetical protein